MLELLRDREAPPAREDAHYRDLAESALLGVYVTRPSGQFVSCNEACARMLGFDSVEEALETDVRTLYSVPAQRDRFLKQLQARGRIERVAVPIRRKDGSIIHVLSSVRAVYGADGHVTELHGFLLDVTDNVRPQIASLEAERRFRSLFVRAADAMFIVDDARVILEANPAAGVLLGLDTSELPGRPLDEFLIDGQYAFEESWKTLREEGEFAGEGRVRSAGRAPRLVEWRCRASFHGGGHFCVARDVTDRRAIEERLIQAEKMESVGRLAGGIAHDFNNLLTAILGYTELLLSNRHQEDPEWGDLAEIQRAGQRAAALTQQLLAYSRKQVLVPKDVDLNETVRGLRRLLTRLIREDITLEYMFSPVPAVVRIDPTQLEQVVLNLVLNARDAMPGGGCIRVEVERVRLSARDTPVDHGWRGPDYVRVRVMDTGVGISPEVRARIFEPFFTTKELGKGTGLGLASVYGIVRQSQGFIVVESEAGKGSTFTMHFPVVSAVSRPGNPPPPPLPAVRQGTILLVEDEDAVRVIAAQVLRRHGYDVLEASGSRAALKIFEQRSREISLLVTDIVMPEINGPTLAQRLIDLRPDLRVLFMSGYGEAASLIDGSRNNVAFLAKPFQTSVLAERVRELLATRAQTR